MALSYLLVSTVARWDQGGRNWGGNLAKSKAACGPGWRASRGEGSDLGCSGDLPLLAPTPWPYKLPRLSYASACPELLDLHILDPSAICLTPFSVPLSA